MNPPSPLMVHQVRFADMDTTTTVAPPPTETIVGELKTSILAGGWIPFSIVLVVSIIL
jgi:hypothetical protein